MNKGNMLLDIKKEIAKLALDMDYENFNDSSNKIKKYLDLLRLVQELPFAASLTEGNENIIEIKSKRMKEIYDIKNNIYVGQIELKLQGGEIGSFKIYVPERTVRELDCSNGDWIKASVINSKRLPNGVVRSKYQFDLVQKESIKLESERQEIKFAFVEYDEILNSFYIKDNYQDSLPLRIMISKRDSEIFSLEKDDLIDYAYWEGDILNGKVIWKHQVDFCITTPPKVKYKSSNIKENPNNEIEKEENILPIFEDNQITVVGFDTMKNNYKDEVEKRGGIFEFLTGDEKLNTIESVVKESNMLIMFVDFVGHGGMSKVRSICKQYDIPITYTKKMGKESFIELVREILKDKIAEEASFVI